VSAPPTDWPSPIAMAARPLPIWARLAAMAIEFAVLVAGLGVILLFVVVAVRECTP
jgi:hypothetical protein